MSREGKMPRAKTCHFHTPNVTWQRKVTSCIALETLKVNRMDWKLAVRTTRRRASILPLKVKLCFNNNELLLWWKRAVSTVSCTQGSKLVVVFAIIDGFTRWLYYYWWLHWMIGLLSMTFSIVGLLSITLLDCWIIIDGYNFRHLSYSWHSKL